MTAEREYAGWIGVTQDTEIEGITAVIEATGYAENIFPDCEVLKVLLDRSEYPRQRDLTLWILTMTHRRLTEANANAPSWYAVQITFYKIEELDLGGFNEQNVISGLLVKRAQKLGVWIRDTYGVGMRFLCERAKVLSIEPSEYRRGR